MLRWTARGLLLAITAFWGWFCVVNGPGRAWNMGLAGYACVFAPALASLIALYVAWRWELAGGLLLLTLTVLGVVFFHTIIIFHDMRLLEQLAIASQFSLPWLAPAVVLLAKCQLERQRVALPG